MASKNLFTDMINNFENVQKKKHCKKTVTHRIGKRMEKVQIMCPAASFEGKIFDTTADDYIAVRMRKIREAVKLARYLGGDELVKKILVHIKAIPANKVALHRFYLEEERRVRRNQGEY